MNVIWPWRGRGGRGGRGARACTSPTPCGEASPTWSPSGPRRTASDAAPSVMQRRDVTMKRSQAGCGSAASDPLAYSARPAGCVSHLQGLQGPQSFQQRTPGRPKGPQMGLVPVLAAPSLRGRSSRCRNLARPAPPPAQPTPVQVRPENQNDQAGSGKASQRVTANLYTVTLNQAHHSNRVARPGRPGPLSAPKSASVYVCVCVHVPVVDSVALCRRCQSVRACVSVCTAREFEYLSVAHSCVCV